MLNWNTTCLNRHNCLGLSRVVFICMCIIRHAILCYSTKIFLKKYLRQLYFVIQQTLKTKLNPFQLVIRSKSFLVRTFVVMCLFEQHSTVTLLYKRWIFKWFHFKLVKLTVYLPSFYFHKAFFRNHSQKFQSKIIDRAFSRSGLNFGVQLHSKMTQDIVCQSLICELCLLRDWA